ncbi:hypothetical protein M432DRAFT_46594 [Thermoascus aurantiacus ATCC 26904]
MKRPIRSTYRVFDAPLLLVLPLTFLSVLFSRLRIDSHALFFQSWLRDGRTLSPSVLPTLNFCEVTLEQGRLCKHFEGFSAPSGGGMVNPWIPYSV